MAIRDVDLSNRVTHIFASDYDALFPRNDLYPSDDLYPVDSGIYLSNNIVAGTMKLDELIVDGEDLIFGNLYSSKFEVQVYGTVVIDGQTVNIGDIDFYGKYIFVFQEDDGVFKRLFTGRVDSSKKNRDGYDKTLVAYDTAYTASAQNIAEWWTTYWSSTALMYNQGSLDVAVAFYSDATSGVETYLNSIYAASSYDHRYALNIYNGKVFYANNNAWTFNQTLSVGSGNKIKTTVIEGISTRTLYKTPIKNLRESLLSHMGIGYESVQLTNDFLCVSKDVDVTALTFGTFLRMICELNCCFPHFDRNNMLEFIVLDVESTASSLVNLYEGENSTFEEYVTAEITGIQFLNSDGEVKYVVGQKTNVYSVSQDNILILNFGTDDLTLAGNNMLEYISDLSYNPCDIKMIVGDLQYELGDRVTTEQGTHFILQNSYSGAQFVEQEIRCEGSELVKESSRTLDTSLLVLNQKIAKVVVSVEEFETEFTEYKTETDGTLTSLSSRITQNSNSITAEVARATTAEGELSSRIQVTADAITSEVTRATGVENTLSSQITQTAEAVNIQVSSTGKEWDTTNETIHYYGNTGLTDGNTKAGGYPASGNTNKVYLNKTNGYLYKSNGSTWVYQKTLSSLQASMNSQFTATSTEIGLKLNSSLYTNAEITARLNNGTSIAKISADKLDLSGLVTISALKTSGQTIINGDNITTGTISAARVNLTGYLKATDVGDSGSTVISGSRITTGSISGRTVTGGSNTGPKVELGGSTGYLTLYYNNSVVGRVSGTTDNSFGNHMILYGGSSDSGNAIHLSSSYIRVGYGDNFSSSRGYIEYSSGLVNIVCSSGLKINSESCASGAFQDKFGHEITVKNGLITDIGF